MAQSYLPGRMNTPRPGMQRVSPGVYRPAPLAGALAKPNMPPQQRPNNQWINFGSGVNPANISFGMPRGPGQPVPLPDMQQGAMAAAAGPGTGGIGGPAMGAGMQGVANNLSAPPASFQSLQNQLNAPHQWQPGDPVHGPVNRPNTALAGAIAKKAVAPIPNWKQAGFASRTAFAKDRAYQRTGAAMQSRTDSIAAANAGQLRDPRTGQVVRPKGWQPPAAPTPAQSSATGGYGGTSEDTKM